jgi:hypothetical protein
MKLGSVTVEGWTEVATAFEVPAREFTKAL